MLSLLLLFSYNIFLIVYFRFKAKCVEENYIKSRDYFLKSHRII